MKLENPYCTLADVQAETGNSKPEVVDTLLNAINLASRLIEAESGRDFLYHDFRVSPWVVPHESVGGNYISMPWPCIDAAGVSVRIDGVEVDKSEFRVVHEGRKWVTYLVRKSAWIATDVPEVSLGAQDKYPPMTLIEVYGQFGFVPAGTAPTENPSPSIPGTVRYAASIIAAVRSGKAKKDAIGPDGTATSVVMKAVPKDVDAIVRGLRIRSSF